MAGMKSPRERSLREVGGEPRTLPGGGGTSKLIVIAVLSFLVGGAAGYLVRGAATGSGGAVGGDVTVTLRPVEDAYVTAENPDNNYGTAAELRTDGDPDTVRSYLRFDLGGVRGTVQRAILRVFAETGNADGYDIRSATGDWREDTLTFSNSPGVGSLIATSNSFDGGDWTSVDVTAAAKGGGTLSLAMTTIGETMTRYTSREGTNSPELVVETTGSPGQAGGAAGSLDGSPSALPTQDSGAQPGAGTAPTSPDDPVIAAAGDIACDPADANFNKGRGTEDYCRMMVTSDLILDAGVDKVLALGDTQYEAGGFKDFKRSYALSWGRLKEITLPAAGNHEYGKADAAGYFRYFGAAAGALAEGYYSHDLGTWHLIALNSNCAKVGGCEIGSSQGDWLKADLAENESKCTLAYWHHPRFSSGEHSGHSAVGTFWESLYAAGADLVLNGHDHDYERFAPMAPTGAADAARGIRQFVVGTGGKNLREFGNIQPNSEVRDSDTYGVLSLTLHPTSYDWRFVPEPGASFADEGSGLCH